MEDIIDDTRALRGIHTRENFTQEAIRLFTFETDRAKQFSRPVLQCRLRAQSINELADMGDEVSREEIGKKAATMLRHLLGDTTSEKTEIRLRDLRAIFDVDGPCNILTPYDPVLERLPRPEARSMEISWILKDHREQISRRNIRETQETLRTLRKAKGMWAAILYSPLTRYALE
ncbi:hypothetical protein AOQ84DRAFT_376237 [Glonium stellatum]|uniref:Uncharacterized protein n=1 Tax=Glonium stellatum TaxID=574774 RepID=A0A8E2F211_9PEZI|nr:hypothetical protein AOQ84DRAFT_376237 [Glonium stellatum]